jgi:hypothetical protein
MRDEGSELRVVVVDDRDWWHDVLGCIRRLWRRRLTAD